MTGGQAEYLLELKSQLESASWKERGGIIRAAAAFRGKSVATLYRELEKMGYDSGRKTRSDKGAICVDKETAMLVGGMIKSATRKNGKKTLPLTTTAEILNDNGINVPHPATLSRAMRRYGCHPAQTAANAMGPHQQLRSLHPNYCWQMDASVCVLFYLPGGKAEVRPVTQLDETLYNEKKPHNLEKLNSQRVTRWVITDHASGCVFVRYRLGAENQTSAIEVLIEAMCARSHEKGYEQDIMHGAPVYLYTDKGGAFIGGMMREFLARLGIKQVDHAAKNARATGQVENGQNLVETQFEGRLCFMTVQSLEELNANAREWQMTWNSTRRHGRHGATRNASWRSITPEQLKVPESAEVLQALASSKPEKRKVPGSLRFTYSHKKHGKHEYSLSGIADLVIGREFMLSVNPWSAPDVDVTFTDADGTERVYTLTHIKKDRYGFDAAASVIGQEQRSIKDTATDKALKEMEKRAYNASTLEEAAKARKAKQPVYQDINIMADIERFKQEQAQGKLRYLPTCGTQLETGSVRKELPNLSAIAAAAKLQARLAEKGLPWNPAYMAALKRDWPDGVPMAELDNLARTLEVASLNEKQKTTPLRVAEAAQVVQTASALRVVGGNA